MAGVLSLAKQAGGALPDIKDIAVFQEFRDQAIGKTDIVSRAKATVAAPPKVGKGDITSQQLFQRVTGRNSPRPTPRLDTDSSTYERINQTIGRFQEYDKAGIKFKENYPIPQKQSSGNSAVMPRSKVGATGVTSMMNGRPHSRDQTIMMDGMPHPEASTEIIPNGGFRQSLAAEERIGGFINKMRRDSASKRTRGVMGVVSSSGAGASPNFKQVSQPGKLASMRSIRSASPISAKPSMAANSAISQNIMGELGMMGIGALGGGAVSWMTGGGFLQGAMAGGLVGAGAGGASYSMMGRPSAQLIGKAAKYDQQYAIKTAKVVSGMTSAEGRKAMILGGGLLGGAAFGGDKNRSRGLNAKRGNRINR